MITKEYVSAFETRIKKDGMLLYTEIGSGINYQKDDGSFEESSQVIVPSSRSGINWECFTAQNRVGFKNNISTGSYSVFSQIGNTGKILKSKPVGIAYLNIQTKEYQFISNLQSSLGVVDGNKITYSDAFQNCDIEYIIEKSRLKQNLIIKSKAGFPGSPYSASDTYVVIVTKFDLANYELPVLEGEDDEIAYDGVNPLETDAGSFRFSDQVFSLGEAEDSNGAKQSVKKRLIRVSGQDYLLEGIPYAYLASATYPVLLDYTTVSGSISSDTTWPAGTYYVSSSVSVTSGTLTIAAGAVVKFASGTDLSISGGAIDINGSSGNPAYFTSANDDTIGETIAGSTGSPAAGDWTSVNSSGNTSITADFGVFRYGTVGLSCQGNFNSALVQDCVFYENSSIGLRIGRNQGSTVTARRCETYNNVTGFHSAGGNNNVAQFEDCYSHDNSSDGFVGFRTTGGHGHRLFNCLSINNGGNGVNGNNTAVAVHVKNSTIDSNTGDGVIISGAAFTSGNIIDSIISNNGGYGVNGNASVTVTFCDLYNNTSGSTNNVGTESDNITTDPDFQTGVIVSDLVDYPAGYFLNQSTSGAIGAGSDTATNLGYDTYTTATDATLDSGTVDIGFHYDPDLVSSSLVVTYSGSLSLNLSKSSVINIDRSLEGDIDIISSIGSVNNFDISLIGDCSLLLTLDSDCSLERVVTSSLPLALLLEAQEARDYVVTGLIDLVTVIQSSIDIEIGGLSGQLSIVVGLDSFVSLERASLGSFNIALTSNNTTILERVLSGAISVLLNETSEINIDRSVIGDIDIEVLFNGIEEVLGVTSVIGSMVVSLTPSYELNFDTVTQGILNSSITLDSLKSIERVLDGSLSINLSNSAIIVLDRLVNGELSAILTPGSLIIREYGPTGDLSITVSPNSTINVDLIIQDLLMQLNINPNSTVTYQVDERNNTVIVRFTSEIVKDITQVSEIVQELKLISKIVQ